MHKLLQAVTLALATLASAQATAEVLQSAPDLFDVRHAGTVAATPQQAYDTITQLPRWWNPQHSWSGDSANMRLDAVAGGCWCERWGQGAEVEHARVLRVLPGASLLLQAKLGPLLDMPVAGVLSISARAVAGRTELQMGYRVGGAPSLALDKLAPVVDGVIGEQFQRLKSMIEGRPLN